jgi:hypothetical protein
MNADTTIYALKGQAQRLQKGLAAINRAISHTQALDLIAQMQGKRNWKELTGLAQADQSSNVQQQAEHVAWLSRLFYVLKMAAINEEDLDDMVHDVLGPEEASSVNNQGMHDQLLALFEAQHFDRKALVRHLEEQLDKRISMPEGSGTDSVIAGSLMTCYGFPEEAEHLFDALDWALQASADDLAAVVRGDYRNCDATDEIGLWMEQQAPNLDERAKIHKLLEVMRTIVENKPDRTGITLEVDAETFGHIVWLRHEYEGLKFDAALLEMLYFDED